MKKRDRYVALADRAIAALDAWLVSAPLARTGSGPAFAESTVAPCAAP